MVLLLSKLKYHLHLFLFRVETTTSFHKPGIYAPLPGEKYIPKGSFLLLPIDNNAEYTVLEPDLPTPETLLDPETPDEVKPIMDPKPDNGQLLPMAVDPPISRTVDSIIIDDEEIFDDNLQYLAPELRDMIKLANNPNDERAIDIWGEDGNRKAFLQQAQKKNKLSSSNLRLLLLYDLLSREAKRQKLSDYSVSTY